MKKLFAYILGLFACAWLVNKAIKMILEVWGVLAIFGVVILVSWVAFRVIKSKDWR
ncbi:hypothetical protein STRDD10_01674 [Streptococcus sp. DD10]|uniref:hypothetical protein n=1 Tax=Streptococcus sp. DD10 TaxID=1777878 RepID=UPI00079BF2F4|nr:hypothetical protein [Streptococcus sp. DD10]KXT73008.1 hypothetical protein STRDD10_01674 [Streptococcus sp. DD10]